MQKLLSICVPTYNRAQELDRQLEWLAHKVIGFEHDCEIIVSDNCSTDETQSVVQKWQSAFTQIRFQANRNDRNIGWIRNFACCLEMAVGKYTWIVGDDDRVYDGTLAYVLQTLKEKSDLALLYLNFSGRNAQTGETMGEHWFDPKLADSTLDSKALFEHCIEVNLGSVIFITAIVFRTDITTIATRTWLRSLDNWAGVAVWAGYCATQGKVAITKENFVECVIGTSHWQKESRIHFKTRYQDTPEVYLSLQGMGYSRSFCRKMILKILQEDFTSIRFIRSFVGSILVKPIWTLKVLGVFVNALMRCFFEFNAEHQPPASTYPAIASKAKTEY